MRDRDPARLFLRWREQGDAEALASVFDAAAPELLRVAAALVRDVGEAEDLLQATFLTAIEKAERFEPDRKLVPWLVGILARHAAAGRRERGRRPDPERLEQRHQPSPADLAADAETRAAFERALAELPPDQREALRAVLLEGARPVDLARARGEAPGAVRMRIHRGLERLRRILPAGAALGAGVSTLGGRGLTAVRGEVLAAGGARAATAAASSAASAGGAATSGGLATLVGGLLMKNAVLGALAVALLGAIAWIAWPEPPAPGSSPPTATARLEETRHAAPPAALAASPPAAPRPFGREIAAPESGEERELAPWAAHAAGCTGRLLEHDGRPLVGVEVTFLALNEDLLLEGLTWALLADSPPRIDVARDTTDGEGHFTLRGARARDLCALGIDLGGPRGALRVLDLALEPGEVVELGDVGLPPTGTVAGTVVDERGAPLAGARVRAGALPREILGTHLLALRAESALLLPRGPGGPLGVLAAPTWLRGWIERLPLPTATTGADGGFELAVPAGEVRLAVDLPRRAPATLDVGLLMPGGRLEVGAVALPGGRIARGRVLDAEGEPVAGAQVLAGGAPASSPLAALGGAVLQAAGRTGPDGVFQLAGLPEGAPVHVAARRHPADPFTIETFDASEAQLDLWLVPEGRIVAHVVDASGAPVTDATVRAIAGMGLDAWDPRIALFASGASFREARREGDTFLLAGLAHGEHLVLATSPGGEVAASVELAGLELALLLELPPTRALAVRVVDAVTGEPVDAARVAVLVHDAESQREGPVASARTGRDGRALLGAPREVLARISVDSPAHARLSRPLAADELAGELEIALDAGATLHARVTGGTPGERYVLAMTRPERLDAVVPPYGLTDAAGEVTLRRLEPGRQRWILLRRFVERDALALFELDLEEHVLRQDVVELEAGATIELEIALGPTTASGAIEGRITIAGRPARSLEVQALQGEGEPRRARVDAAGAFRLEGVPAGRVVVYVNRTAEPTPGEIHISTIHMAEVEVPAHGVARLDLAWDPASIEVTVLDAGGSPAEGVLLLAAPANPVAGTRIAPMGRTDARGRGTLEILEAGRWRIDAKHTDLGRAGGIVEVGAGAVAELVLRMEEGLTLAGEVVLEPGTAPLEREPAYLILMPMDRAPQPAAIPLAFEHERAPFTVRGLGEGRYQARVLAGNTTSQDLVLTVPPGGQRGLVLRPAWSAPDEAPR